jgi:hypothetical protein
MLLKPKWQVEVSMAAAWRAAGHAIPMLMPLTS